jgi:hypothetical protein
MQFIASSPGHKDKYGRRVLRELTLPGVDAGQTKSCMQELVVPEMPLLNLGPCHIIKVYYDLLVIGSFFIFFYFYFHQNV